jgi:hypothetical protein
MKNACQPLIIALMLCSCQLSYGAFPVKHSIVTAPSLTSKEPATTQVTRNTSHKSWLTTRVENVLKPFSNLLNPERRRDDTLGILSLVFGILGVVGAFPLALAAVITGAIGKKQHEQYAKAGFTLGIVGLAIVAFVVIIVFAFRV